MDQSSVLSNSTRRRARSGGFVLLLVLAYPAQLAAQETSLIEGLEGWRRSEPAGLFGGSDLVSPGLPAMPATHQYEAEPINPCVPIYSSLLVPAEPFPTVPFAEVSTFGEASPFDMPLPEETVEPQAEQTLWWNDGVGRPQLNTGAAIGLTLDQLFELAAEHSAKVQAISQQPLIAQTQIGQARAAFDPRLFCQWAPQRIPTKGASKGTNLVH